MLPNPLASPEGYQAFVYRLPEQHPSIRHSTLVYIPSGTLFGRTEGMVVFSGRIVLCVLEYQKEKLYWYDSFPHPNDPTLASTHPHHKHVPPNIKRNRIPAPDLSFTRPNLPFLIEEIEQILSD
jgi:hypothetical protein